MACFVFSWMENFIEIRTKEGQILPFSMNTIQELLAQYVAKCWHREMPVKLMLPKSRQMGSSTFWQCLFFAMCELRPGYRVVVVAHDEVGSREVFSRAFTALRRIRRRGDWDEPALLQEQGGLILWESESSMQAATIKTGDAIGRGGTPSGIHFSETANFSDRGINAKAAVAAIMNACADTKWTIVVHESTAKGKDPFFWPKCEDARDPGSGSAFSLIFLPWFLEHNYQMPWAEYRKQIMTSGKPDPGTKFEITPEEEALRHKLMHTRVKRGQETWRYRYTLSDSQLIWRRWAIVNKCEGDLDQFKREYPSTYEEAFTASSACFFNPTTIDWYRQNALPHRYEGYLYSSPQGPMFQRHTGAPLHLWELPVPGTEYVLGADPGGEKRSADPYAAYVLEKHSLRAVALLHGRFEWDDFADFIFQLGLFYNEARIVCENNHRPAIAKKLHRDRYPNLHYYFEQGVAREREGKTPGYNMNIKTRKEVLAGLKRAFRNKQIWMPDGEFWREMEDFVWVPKASAVNPAPGFDGMYRATGGNHDDRIMACGLALTQCIRPEITFNPTDPPERVSAAYKWFLKFKADEDDLRSAGNLILGVPDA